MAKQLSVLQKGALGAAPLALTFLACTAHADEGGASIYLLGSGAPNAAVLPPLQGVYFDNTIYVYDGHAGAQKDLVINGKVVADVRGTIAADFATLLWVPSTNVAGGTLALGAALPFGAVAVNARAVLTGPLGRSLDISRHDSTLVVGDPIATASLGWKSGKTHITASTMVNIPIGNYNEGSLADLAFHRWAVDVSLAGSWHDEAQGWDVSGKAGVTFNGMNHATDYDSGNDLHFELSAEKTFQRKFSAGIFGYQFVQISGDSGPGATLGPFKGKVTGLGATMAYNTIMGRSPATFRLRVAQEFWNENRLQGTAVMLSFSLPLSMKMPAQMPSPAAAGQ
jgi:hypothetical protein